MHSDDEYSAFDFSEFNEDDFRQIDAGLVPPTLRGSPIITVELEKPSEQPGNTPKSVTSNNLPTEKSPYRRYRRGGVLSVSDLTSLAWCEVQYDYGLRQKRSRPIASRPVSFVSAEGKEIFVQKSVAVMNDRIMKQGSAIHKELEREIRVEELKVDITSEEERWALRLVNMLASLNCMMLEGFTREMPVFGVIHDQVVVGIIDEVVRSPRPLLQLTQSKRSSPSSHSTPRSKKPRRSTSPSQQRITEFLPGTPKDPPLEPEPVCEDCPSTPPQKTLRSPQQQPHYTIELRDTKTRRKNSLPFHEDTLPSRIQLMLYHRLLQDLVSPSPAFDFDYLWKRMNLKSSKVFSTRFLVQAGLITESDSFRVACLDDLAQAWTDMVQELDVCGIDPTLEIVYRLQPATPKWKRKDKGKERAPEVIHLTQEDQDLARAIEASLSDQRRDPSQGNGLDTVSAGEIQENISSQVKECSVEHPEEGLVSPGSSKDDKITSDVNKSLNAPDEHNILDEDLTPDDMTIIGTKTFDYDDAMLNEHVARTLEWWYGNRNPRGVSLEQSRRCFSCEYESSCEWRERKASEFRRNQGRD